MKNTVREWIREQEIRGKTMFSFEEVAAAFPGVGRQIVQNSLLRLKKNHVLYSPYRAFFVILPPQYVLRGGVPPYYYMDELMRYLHKEYYFGLLTAAAIWGAAHQRPQVDFVMTELPRLSAPPVEQRMVHWGYRKQMPTAFICEKNGEAGVVRYSSAELTAVELVQFEQYVGGLSVVATVLGELLDSTDFARASEGVFKVCKDSAIQRMGYLVERVIGDELRGEVIYHEWTRLCKAPHFIPLSLRSKGEVRVRDERWKIDVNAQPEVDEI